MIELSEEQRRELEHSGPVYVRDPRTKEMYVLVRAELYERLTTFFSEDWAEDGYKAAMQVFARDGWDDPRMDVYDALDPRRPS